MAVPAADDFRFKKPPVEKVLEFTFPNEREPDKSRVPASVTPPALVLMIIFFSALDWNVPAAMVWGAGPFISTVPFAALKVPLLLMAPFICSVEFVIVNTAALCIVMVSTVAVPALIIGKTLPASKVVGIVVSTVTSGIPPYQLPCVNQSDVPAAPVHIATLDFSPIAKDPKEVNPVAWIDVGNGEANVEKAQLEPLYKAVLKLIVIEPASTSDATQLNVEVAVVKTIPELVKVK